MDAYGGIWSVISPGMNGRVHCTSPDGHKMQVDAARFVTISARKKGELPTAGERRKWYFRKMGWA